MRIDLNADLGEGGADDLALLELVTSVNVACGFHAGDADSMDTTVAAAARKGVCVGAHPSFPDREGFGRTALSRPPALVRADVLEQVRALRAICCKYGVRLRHVKPHGALYNQAAEDPALAAAIAAAVHAVDPSLILVGRAGSGVLRDAAQERGLRFAAEAFADRRYLPSGALVPRSIPGAVLSSPNQAAEQAVRIVTRQEALADDGKAIVLRADTLCLHGDGPGALAVAQAVHSALAEAGVEVAALAP